MSPHKVPVYLNQPDGIGRFSLRQIFLGGGSLFYVAPAAWSVAPSGGPALGDLLRMFYPGLGFVFQNGSLPVFPMLYAIGACAPMWALALPLEPPVEHGAMAASKWIAKHGYLDTEDFKKNLGRITVKGNRVESDFGIGAVWELPGRNLRLAANAEVEQAQDLWGEFLNGLTAPIQTLIISNRTDPEKIVGAIEKYRPGKNTLSPSGAAATFKGTGKHTPVENAHRVATWLREHAKSAHLIERRHYLSFHAEDEQTYVDTEQEIADGLGALGLRTDQIRRLEGAELREVVQRTWSPGEVPQKGILGPTGKPFNASDTIYLDGEWHITMAFGKWMRIARDNALSALSDGVYDVDVIEHITPLDAEDILSGLERRADAMRATSGHHHKRTKALEDLESFISDLGETESPFDVSVLLHIHGPEKKLIKTEAKKIFKRVRRSGARANRLTWEQAQAMQAVAPLGLNHLDNRSRRVDTSSVKRLYPWSASAMWMDDAVPWGETIDSHRPVGLNVWRRPLIANPHMAVYMMSGGGKGFGWKVLSSRSLFAGLTQEFFGFDQAEEDLELGEYGRWAEYCGIEYRHVLSAADFDAALADLDNHKWLGPGICWNIAQLAMRDRPEFFVRVKDKLWERATHLKARRQWAVDELWSFVKSGEAFGTDPHWQISCVNAIEDLVRRGRHQLFGAAFFTQRAKDSLDVPVMKIIQSQCATQVFGPQNPAEISEVKEGLDWTDADVRAIKSFSPGQCLVVAGPWKVAMRVTASDDEFDNFNTDGKPSREETTPSTEGDTDA